MGALTTGSVAPASTWDHIRWRRCSCGNDMNIRVGLDVDGKLIDIQCVSGSYLRRYTAGQRRSARFRLKWNEDGQSTFIHCNLCGARRAWHLFKELQ
jgi:hypothetical protein